MRIQDIIAAKRDGKELSEDDISKIVLEYAKGSVPDYQMSAFLMAAYLKGLNYSEIFSMTKAMINSGSMLDLSEIRGIKVDKHSTGGVGDKTTLVIVPVLAACGLKVAKMSGRGLGFTGGTIDKLESIPGFRTALSKERVVEQIKSIGATIAGQTADMVPADKKMYALRDVTATVDSIPLIAASVMSKKIASSSDVILLDVKAGSGAFAKNIEQAQKLADTMISIGRSFGKKVGAIISDMSQPLGRAVGNALEVEEAIDVLKGGGPADLKELCIELCSAILYMSEQVISISDGRNRSIDCIASGTALEKFKMIISSQGGSADVVDDISILPKADIRSELYSSADGYVAEINCEKIGVAASILGAGRNKKEDRIDPSVGIIVNKKIGDRVKNGDLLAVLYANDAEKLSNAKLEILKSYKISAEYERPALIHKMIL